MKQLSGLDAAFLHLELPEMPMHIGALHLFDLPPGYRGSFFDNVKDHVASRLHLAGLFTKKLANLPMDFANPVWVEDTEVDLDYHVQHVVLPKPGSMAQLETLVGRLHSHLLDRSRPLWEFHVIEGLKSGQWALYTKVHHSAVDGVGASSLVRALLDPSPHRRELPPASKRDELDEPGVGKMVAHVLRHTAEQYWKIVKYLPATAKAAGALLLPARVKGSKGMSGVKKRFSAGPKTPLNVQVTSQRSLATVRIPLVEAKTVAKAFDGSLNDAVLAVCSAALRRYLDAKGALPKEPLKVAMPVNLRAEGDAQLNNQFSFAFTDLPTDRADAKTRIEEIVKASTSLKTTFNKVKSALPTDLPSIGVPWLMSGIASLYHRSRLANKMPPIANVLISNVPGSQAPLYMAGARMTSFYPLSIPLHGIALNITVMSYDGALDFGLIACRKAVPDVRELAMYMSEAHLELMALLKEKEIVEKVTNLAVRRRRSRKTVKTGTTDTTSAKVTRLPVKASGKRATQVAG